MLDPAVIQRIGAELSAPADVVEATLRLLESGATVSFIARYRRSASGNLGEFRIRQIDNRRRHYRALVDRRLSLLATMEKQGQIHDDTRHSVLSCHDPYEIDDLYLPFKSKKRTPAGDAIAKGVGPLADFIWEQTRSEPVEAVAASLVNEQKGLATPEAVIEETLTVLEDRVAGDIQTRRELRELLHKHGKVRARLAEGRTAEKSKYAMYYSFEEAAAKIPSHRMLAIRRGTRENILTYSVEADDGKVLEGLLARLIRDRESQFAPLLERAIRGGYEKGIRVAIQNEVRSWLLDRAEAEAIRVFEDNLRALLLTPPAGPIPVIGVDPAPNGCRFAVLDEDGRVLEHYTLNSSGADPEKETAEHLVAESVRKHGVRGIGIGNGTTSREVESFIRGVLRKNGIDAFTTIVNEAGAAAFASSSEARKEFPGTDTPVRAAISIARRLQDPLAELVKIDPKSIGVGQYQHDVDQRKLRQGLVATVASCVNHVGVDVNRATVDSLRYVSGLSESVAAAIVAYRSENGGIKSRSDLLKVTGISEKVYTQCAGFLRVPESENPLDRTAIHPESYALVDRIASTTGTPLPDLIGNETVLNGLDLAPFESDSDKYTIADVREALLRPAKDPRGHFAPPRFSEDVTGIADLKTGMVLEGAVTNVTNFGAFVDLGVYQDGLVHISEMSHKFVQDARQAVKVGDVVQVKVIGVDPDLKRISLSIRAVLPKPARKPQRKQEAPRPAPEKKSRQDRPRTRESTAVAPRKKERPRPEPRPEPAPAPVLSMEEKIRLLQEKFRGPVK